MLYWFPPIAAALPEEPCPPDLAPLLDRNAGRRVDLSIEPGIRYPARPLLANLAVAPIENVAGRGMVPLAHASPARR